MTKTLPHIPWVEPYYDSEDVVLYHGDCLALLDHIPTKTIDLLLTDPPYGMNLDVNYNGSGRQSVTKVSPETWGKIIGDNEPFDPSHLLRFDRKIIFGGNYFADKLPISGAWVVWDKLDGLTSKRQDEGRIGFNDNSDGELAWTNIGEGLRIVRHRWLGQLKASERRTKRIHPTQKPVSMLMRLLTHYSKPGDVILDPYAGSMSTAVACRATGRLCIAIEMHEPYCRSGSARLQQSALGLDWGDED